MSGIINVLMPEYSRLLFKASNARVGAPTTYDNLIADLTRKAAYGGTLWGGYKSGIQATTFTSGFEYNDLTPDYYNGFGGSGSATITVKHSFYKVPLRLHLTKEHHDITDPDAGDIVTTSDVTAELINITDEVTLSLDWSYAYIIDERDDGGDPTVTHEEIMYEKLITASADLPKWT